jgi:ATP-dependent DNA helicase PIF1
MKQAQALRVLMDGGSVFLTGAPGAGKSYVLNQFVRMAERAGKRVAVTASTGIAATHIGGVTIHSWSGLGIREALSQHDLDILAARDRLAKRYLTTDILVIDEVSMLHGRFLNMLDLVCKKLRDNEAPFGGLQMVLVGDMFQLPPVSRGSEVADFAHESESWRDLAPQICYITEQHRQTGDGLLDVLEAMRDGSLEEVHKQLLTARMHLKPETGVNVTRLYAHNADVDTINLRHLQALATESEIYEMTSKGAAAKVEQLMRGILAPEVLELKVGAEVMFVANDFAKGFANGSRGKVVSVHGDWPVVRLVSNGRSITVEPHTWQLAEDGRVRAEVSQLPLRLAWAITIHKSQGMSLDAAEIDLSRSFTPGMGYVALSRVRSLDGVYLSGLNAMALQLHPDIFELDQALRQASAELGLRTEDYVAPEPIAESAVPGVDSVLLDKLKTWRRIRAESESLPAYIVAHNTVLEEVAKRLPRDEMSLMTIRGMGKAKLATIGEDILTIVREYIGKQPDSTPESTEEVQAPSVPETDQAISEERVAKATEVKAVYPRSGKRWTPEEEETLMAHLQAMTPLSRVCDELQRSPGSVWAHVATMLYKG